MLSIPEKWDKRRKIIACFPASINKEPLPFIVLTHKQRNITLLSTELDFFILPDMVIAGL